MKANKTFPAQGTSSKHPDLKDDVAYLSSVIPANDTIESVFGNQNFPYHEQGSNLRPLAPEASAQPLKGNFGSGVRASFLKPTPIVYLVFQKNDPFIYLIEQNVYIFIYCSLIFIYPLCCL